MDLDLDEMVAAANAYEELFVRSLFQPWASRIADAAGIRSGQNVLDVACGTGVLARECLRRLGGDGSVAGLDSSPGMLAVAERLAPEVAWRQGTAEALPYPEGSFDAVVSQFGLMFFQDRQGGLAEMRRVLAAGGHLAVAVWNSLDENPAYAAEVDLLQRLAGTAAADAVRAPFVLGDASELASLGEAAGWDAPEVRTESAKAQFPSIRAMVEADLRGWLPVMGVVLPEAQIQQILEEAEQTLGDYVTEQGQFVFDVSAHLMLASRQN